MKRGNFKGGSVYLQSFEIELDYSTFEIHKTFLLYRKEKRNHVKEKVLFLLVKKLALTEIIERETSLSEYHTNLQCSGQHLFHFQFRLS